MAGSLASIALRQAEERTRLVVDCAGLVRRMEELDAEMAEYDQWQRYPTRQYGDKVQMRFEEARKREAAEARRRGETEALAMAALRPGAVSPGLSPRSPLGGFRRPATPLGAEDAEEEADRKLSLQHLQRALRAADFEADVWRQRALDMETASEREREQAKRLMEFELSTAMKQAEQERARMLEEVRERDLQFDVLEQEHQAMARDRDAHFEALCEARRQVDHHQALYRRLEEISMSREQQLAEASQELHRVRSSGEANNSRVAQLQMELQASESVRDEQMRTLQSFQAEARRLADVVSKRDAQLASVQRDLDEALHEREMHRDELQRLEAEVRTLEAEREAKLEVVASAQHRAELLSAKCGNLEAALANATSKQADLAMEREAHRERAERLEDKLRRSLDPHQQEAKATLKDSSYSGASTAASSTPASPRLPQKPLPPVRPPSASRLSPKERRDVMMHSNMLCKNL